MGQNRFGSDGTGLQDTSSPPTELSSFGNSLNICVYLRSSEVELLFSKSYGGSRRTATQSEPKNPRPSQRGRNGRRIRHGNDGHHRTRMREIDPPFSFLVKNHQRQRGAPETKTRSDGILKPERQPHSENRARDHDEAQNRLGPRAGLLESHPPTHEKQQTETAREEHECQNERRHPPRNRSGRAL